MINTNAPVSSHVESILSVINTLLVQGSDLQGLQEQCIQAEAPRWGCHRVVSLALGRDVLGLCVAEGVWGGVFAAFFNEKNKQTTLSSERR